MTPTPSSKSVHLNLECALPRLRVKGGMEGYCESEPLNGERFAASYTFSARNHDYMHQIRQHPDRDSRNTIDSGRRDLANPSESFHNRERRTWWIRSARLLR